MDDLPGQVDRIVAFTERPGIAPDSLAGTSIAELIERELEQH